MSETERQTERVGDTKKMNRRNRKKDRLRKNVEDTNSSMKHKQRKESQERQIMLEE